MHKYPYFVHTSWECMHVIKYPYFVFRVQHMYLKYTGYSHISQIAQRKHIPHVSHTELWQISHSATYKQIPHINTRKKCTRHYLLARQSAIDNLRLGCHYFLLEMKYCLQNCVYACVCIHLWNAIDNLRLGCHYFLLEMKNCLQNCVYACMYTSMYVWMNVCTHVCIHVCVCMNEGMYACNENFERTHAHM